MRKICLGLIRVYQWVLSPYLGQSCRFTPTCSHYAYQAFSQYGTVRATWLTLKRIARCHPWAVGGHDPVP